MSRKTKHVPVSLHPLSVDQLPKEEISTILRGADELELVRSGLDDTMRVAYQAMREVWHARDDVHDLRTAAYLVSIGKVAASYRAKGL